MKVSIQYDMTVRRLARALVERSAVYQNNFDKYNIGASAENVEKPLETLYTMLLEVAETTRDTQQHEKLMAATSSESRKLKMCANASFSANQQDGQASAYAGHSPATCSIENCPEPVPAKLIESFKK